MPVKELKEPIWERQEGETPNQHDWFNEFLDYPGYNLKAFHDSLESQKESEGVSTFDKIPSYNMFMKWSSHNKWMLRKKAKRDFDKEEEREELKQIKRERLVDNFRSKQKIKKQLLKEISLGLTMGKPLSQINQGIQGYVTFSEDDRKDLGENTENLNITADVDTEIKVKQNVASDIIMNPKYAELTRSILEDLIDDGSN